MFGLLATLAVAACACASAATGWELHSTVASAPHVAAPFESGEQQSIRQLHLAALRRRAQARMAEDLIRYSADELQEIEAHYLSTRLAATSVPDRSRRRSLEALVSKYPRSNRAGCAVVELAQMSTGDVREQLLETAIAEHGDAWFESGAQVGPLARALLATHYAGLDRLDEAEKLAAEIAEQYPGSIDSAGWPLDDMLAALKLLRAPR